MFGLTTKIHGFVLTRDSWLFFWGKLVGFAGLITTGVINPTALGLNEKQKDFLMVCCGTVLAIAAHYGTSPLPGKADADKVSLPLKGQA